MTKACDDASVPPIISRPRGRSHSFVRCRCDWTTDGTKYNLIWRILRDGHTERIMWRHCGCKSMPIAEFDAFIFRTDYTRRTSYLQNSNYFYQSKSIND